MEFQFTAEQRMWRDVVHAFAATELRPFASELDQKEEFNLQAVKKMAEIGLLGMNVPEQYHGAGIDTIGAVIAIEELGWACGGTALSIAAHNSLGCGPVVLFGSEDQKHRWLPTMATGGPGHLGALALTEPEAGSDLVGGIQTRAEAVDGSWMITGNKAWITNASQASLIITLCRTGEIGDTGSLSLILVPVNTPGVTVNPAEHKMGVRSSPTHSVTYDTAKVPIDNTLGKPGEGLYQTLQILDSGRIGIGALSVGLARAAQEEAIRYARERQAFGKPLAKQQAIQWMIADAETEIEAARLLVLRAAWLRDQGHFFNKEAAIAKLYATEMAERVCRNAIQILGSYGYSREYPVERMYRDARLMTIGEGTSEVQRMVIAKRTLGEE
jgi:alkylation response protein AidB-like acyl-CoA dehydrogenase